MTEPEPSESDELLKADVLGRVRVRPEHRERMLDALESSGMSGQVFAIHHGIKVQTFASWRQKLQERILSTVDGIETVEARFPIAGQGRGFIRFRYLPAQP